MMFGSTLLIYVSFGFIESSRIRTQLALKSSRSSERISEDYSHEAISIASAAIPIDVSQYKTLVNEGIISEEQSVRAQHIASNGSVDIFEVLRDCRFLPADPLAGYCGEVYGAEVKMEPNKIRGGMIVASGVLIVVWIAIAGVYCSYQSGGEDKAPLSFLSRTGTEIPERPRTQTTMRTGDNTLAYPSHWNTTTIHDVPEETAVATDVWGFSVRKYGGVASLVMQIGVYTLLLAMPTIAIVLLIVEFKHAGGKSPTDMCYCGTGKVLTGDDPLCNAGQGIYAFRKNDYLELRCFCADKKAKKHKEPWSEDKVYRPEGVDLVLDMALLVTSGKISKEDYAEQVGACEVTVDKRDEFEHLLQLSEVLGHEIKCDDNSDDFDSCFDGELVQDRRLLFRKAALARMTRSAVATARDEEDKDKCKCRGLGNVPIKAETLVEFAQRKRIPMGGTLMREAASEYCLEEGNTRGVSMIATFQKLCSPEQWGYCCQKVADGIDPHAFAAQKLTAVTKAFMDISEMTENVLTTSDELERAVLKTSQDDSVKGEAKVLLFKLFIIFYHHAQLFLRRQEYCTMHPEDLAACEDPLTYKTTVTNVYKELDKSAKAMKGLVSCMRTGARPLGEELELTGFWQKVAGVVSNLILRAIHELGTGKLIKRVRSLALSLGKTVWKYRFEIMIAGVVTAGAQPLMVALTSTGITTGVATSWSLVFEQLIRNIILHIGCPIISSPMLMSMVLRWAMANIILHETFIELVIKPLWTMAKASLGPIAIGVDMINTGFDVIRTMLGKIREKIRSNKNQTNATMEVQKTWLETAREFHQTPAADFLYLACSVYMGWIWRLVATLACTVGKVALPVFNGAESVVEAATQGASNIWMQFMGGASNLFKTLLGDPSSATVQIMQAQNATALASMGTIAPKVLGAAHSMLYSVNIVASTSINVVLDLTIGSLSYITQNAVISLGVAQLFAWFFKTWWNPEDKQATVHDRSLQMQLDSARTQFNSNTCEGKKNGQKCLFLNQPNLGKEEVVDGTCCRSVCQVSTTCDVDPMDARVDEAWDPKAVSWSHLQTQSRYLLNFIRMARASYGEQCKMHPALLQTNASIRATPFIAS